MRGGGDPRGRGGGGGVFPARPPGVGGVTRAGVAGGGTLLEGPDGAMAVNAVGSAVLPGKTRTATGRPAGSVSSPYSLWQSFLAVAGSKDAAAARGSAGR